MDILYIAGFGRSGSTVLERVLGAHPQIQALGEFHRFYNLIQKPETLCSCGQPLDDCQFWGPVAQLVRGARQGKESPPAVVSAQHKVEPLWSPLVKNQAGMQSRYAEAMGTLFKAVERHAQPDLRYVIDSSKSSYYVTFRPLRLSQLCDLNVKVIHMVRDPRAVVWSEAKRGDNRKLEKGIQSSPNSSAVPKALLGWRTANALSAGLRSRLGPQKYLLLRYEDFVVSPNVELRRIGEFLDISLEGVIDDLAQQRDFALAHQISGNRMRSATKIVLKPDFEWQERMSPLTKNLCYWAAWPGVRRYGY